MGLPEKERNPKRNLGMGISPEDVEKVGHPHTEDYGIWAEYGLIDAVCLSYKSWLGTSLRQRPSLCPFIVSLFAGQRSQLESETTSIHYSFLTSRLPHFLSSSL